MTGLLTAGGTTLRKMTPEERLRRLEQFGRFFFGENWRGPTYRFLAGKAPQGPTYLTRVRWDRVTGDRKFKQEAVPDWMLEACVEYIELKYDQLAEMRARFRGK